MSEKDLSKLEKIIDYKFNDKKYLKIALTHKSYLDEQTDYLSNQRYEFLGDTILDFDLTLYLFNNFPNLDEGNLTKIRSSAVDQSSLVALGKKINIGDFIFLSKSEDASGGRNKKSIIEDAVEALIAAIYFDGGLENVNKFVSKYIYPNIKELSQDPGKKDYKTRLQEHYAKIGKKVTYENTSTGPDHSKEFSSKVLLSDNVIGTGKGKSKKNAEQMAAKAALLNAKN
ncbi:MAG: ribonuclease III [Actinomycetota bacterium]|jgi:ribonuclease-3|nr:ribonuclease III [Actinomycetota bacterium]|tara:strand:+ start:354 stop:1037 length:684 start_codon:yes stop_codon:yes gene_type:complete